LKVTINSVNVEWIQKGKSKYGKAAVSYTFNGEQRNSNIMSFVNPNVFKQVQELEGQEVEVTLTKNAQGYSEWSSISAGGITASKDGNTPTAPATSTRVTGSNYETSEERAQRQVYIVKQSSISSAISLLKTEQNSPSVEEVLSVAQSFVDFVFGNNTEES
jgi:hypothetical protein